MHGGGAGGLRVCELGHKRGQWGHMYGDLGLCCMSCDGRMHGAANDTMQSGVMCICDEPGRSTVYFHCFDRKLCTSTATVP